MLLLRMCIHGLMCSCYILFCHPHLAQRLSTDGLVAIQLAGGSRLCAALKPRAQDIVVRWQHRPSLGLAQVQCLA